MTPRKRGAGRPKNSTPPSNTTTIAIRPDDKKVLRLLKTSFNDSMGNVLHRIVCKTITADMLDKLQELADDNEALRETAKKYIELRKQIDKLNETQQRTEGQREISEYAQDSTAS